MYRKILKRIKKQSIGSGLKDELSKVDNLNGKSLKTEIDVPIHVKDNVGGTTTKGSDCPTPETCASPSEKRPEEQSNTTNSDILGLIGIAVAGGLAYIITDLLSKRK